MIRSAHADAVEIVHSRSTALYNFNLSSWEKLGIQGGLFITRNRAAPFYSTVVLNKDTQEFRVDFRQGDCVVPEGDHHAAVRDRPGPGHSGAVDPR